MEKDQDFSTNSCESFAWWDQSTLSWRTLQRCLLEGWIKFSERLPRMGTMRNGKLYQRKAWVRRIDGTECSLSDAWPTPSAQEPGIKTNRLVDKNGNQPTHSSQRLYDKETGRLCQKGLTQAVQIAALWPTPKATDGTKGSRTKEGAEKELKRGKNLDLGMVAALWPTPTANEDAAGTPHGKMQKMLGNHPDVRNTGAGTLNPQWVEWLMGFPDGWTDLNA